MPSLALDFAPYAGGIDWGDVRQFCVVAGAFMLAAAQLREEGEISSRLRWGGDFDMDGTTTDQLFLDLGHIELILLH